MNIHFLTIVYNGMPWITHHLPVLNQLPFDWTWHVVEGTATPTHCTSWCKPIPPSLSTDGTHEYLRSIAHHPRIRLYEKPQWDGKISMVNAPLPFIRESCLLWEIDCDEIWTTCKIEQVIGMFKDRPENCINFNCRFFVGPNLILKRIPNTYANHDEWEWRRVFRFEPGMLFERHEPPVMAGVPQKIFQLPFWFGFDHYAYALESQVAFKEKYYGYPGGVDGWRRLQANQSWPAKLRDFFPWVKDEATVIKLYD